MGLSFHSIHVPADVAGRVVADLPAGISLQPGELRIEFFGTEDLLRHLFELSQAILNDYERFDVLVEGNRKTESVELEM